MAADRGPNFTARPTLKINLKAVKANYKALQKRVTERVKVAASVKADAYGLGATKVSRALYGAGCRNFFVATPGEGKDVRAAVGDNASIYVLNGPAPRDLSLYFGARLKPVINSLVQAHIWADATKGVKSAPFSAIHIDTGMNRLGFPLDEFEKFSQNRLLRDAVGFDHVLSHLACAPDKDHSLNGEQLIRFKKAAAKLPVKPMSLANSAGIYLGRKYHFQMVRPGISLYGGAATNDPEQEVTQPVVSLMAPVLQVKQISQGESLGYNATFKAPKDMSIAIVGSGYADGIPVAASGTGKTQNHNAAYQGKLLQIIGRVSMDLTILDTSSLRKPPRIGEWVEFRGEQLEADAEQLGTINYELLTSLSKRAQRIYE